MSDWEILHEVHAEDGPCKVNREGDGSIGKRTRSNRVCQTMILGSMPRDKSLLKPPRVRTNRTVGYGWS